MDTSRNTGKLGWKYVTNGAVSASPVVAADGTVYVLVGSHTLDAIAPPNSGTSGVLKWSHTVPASIGWAYWDRISAPAIGQDGVVYFLYDRLYGVAATGTGSSDVEPWACDAWLAGTLAGTPPIVGNDGTVYVVADQVAAIRFPSGGRECVVQWTFDTQPTGIAPAVGRDGSVYFGAEGGLHAISPPFNGTIGMMKWSSSWGATTDSAPTLSAEGTLYAGLNAKVSAIDATTGLTAWTFDTRSRMVNSSAVGPDGTLYFTSSGGSLFAIEATGGLKWSYKLGGESTLSASSPALGGDGTVYAGAADGNLYAVNAPVSGATGILKWSYSVGGSVGSPSIGADGTVYVGSDNGTVCAIH